MKEIQLTKGYVALVDDEDFERVNQHSWCVCIGKTNTYAQRNYRKANSTWSVQMLHRFILGVSDRRLDVDHEDHNGLNCQRYNMRACTRTQNMMNRRKGINNTTGCKGVQRNTGRGKPFKVTICVEGLNRHIGTFSNLQDAHDAYAAAALQHFGEFAYTGALTT